MFNHIPGIDRLHMQRLPAVVYSGLERNQIGIPGIMEVAIQLPALRITTSVLSKGCADINSLVAMPLCVLWGVASQL